MSKNTVNPSLTRRRARQTVENDAYGEFTRRVVRGYARRVAAGDVEALADMVGLADELESSIRAAVVGLRGFGYSWQEIADRLKVSRQAAHKRWAQSTR
ncbi:hypothetical protein [Micromonospora aurantiaca (nom. illeg.)]|uniref:hypothetical protein n=1 Tax=Micromonospora aurantiaca (nom. illeg.) TaxID=47850 RepID=UPI003F49FDA5